MTPTAAVDATRRALTAAGQSVTLRRLADTAAQTVIASASVLAVLRDYQPHELVNGLRQGDCLAILLAADLQAASFPVPPRQGDQIEANGRKMTVIACDDQSRRVQGVVIAYEIKARG